LCNSSRLWLDELMGFFFVILQKPKGTRDVNSNGNHDRRSFA
jgi:hypothetical protein